MTPDQLQSVRDFVSGHLLSRGDRSDFVAEAPSSYGKQFHETGLSNWWIGTEYGGLGLGLRDGVDIVSGLAYGDAGAAFTLFISILGTSMVSLYGSDELRNQHLPSMVIEGGFCATLASERAAGSELMRLSTTATRAGDDVVVTGDKFFSTNAEYADFLVVVAAYSEGGHVAVLLPRETPGVTIAKRWETIGLRSSRTYQVNLDECRVPAANILDGHGIRLLEIGLNASRILIASCAVGIGRRIRDLCMEYADTKVLRREPLTSSTVFAAKLGQMEADIEVMRNQCHAAAREYDDIMAARDAAGEFRRRGALRSSLTAKLFCGQTGWRLAGTGSEMFGGLGYTHDSIMGKLLCDMRYVSVIEGGDDVMRDLIYSRFVVPADKRI